MEAVGKTAIVSRLVQDSFDPQHRMTIGSAVPVKDLVKNGILVRLQVWDTSGGEHFRSIAPLYYRNADVVLIVYDVTSQIPFDAIGQWVNDAKQYGPSGVLIALLGNKVDRTTDRVVATVVGSELVRVQVLFFFAETSALTGEGISDVIDDLLKLLMMNQRPRAAALEQEKNDDGCQC
jgi:Ras-related protein Rab-5C